MVRHNDFGAFQRAAGLEERALREERAATIRAAAMICRNRRPGLGLHALRPVVQLAVPLTGAKAHQHALEDDVVFRVRLIDQRKLSLATALQHIVQSLEADISSPAFGEGEAELQPGVQLQIGQIPQHHLLLKSDGCGADHDGLSERTRHRNARDRVRRRFAGAGAGLNRGDPVLRMRQGAGDVGHHLALTAARFEAPRFEPGGVRALDLSFGVVSESGHKQRIHGARTSRRIHQRLIASDVRSTTSQTSRIGAGDPSSHSAATDSVRHAHSPCWRNLVPARSSSSVRAGSRSDPHSRRRRGCTHRSS